MSIHSVNCLGVYFLTPPNRVAFLLFKVNFFFCFKWAFDMDFLVFSYGIEHMNLSSFIIVYKSYNCISTIKWTLLNLLIRKMVKITLESLKKHPLFAGLKEYWWHILPLTGRKSNVLGAIWPSITSDSVIPLRNWFSLLCCGHYTNACWVLFWFSDVEDMFTLATEAVSATLRDSKAIYILETDKESSVETPQPVILRGTELDLQAEFSNMRLQDGTPQVSGAKQLSCAYFCLNDKDRSSFTSVEVNFMSIAFSFPHPHPLLPT